MTIETPIDLLQTKIIIYFFLAWLFIWHLCAVFIRSKVFWLASDYIYYAAAMLALFGLFQKARIMASDYLITIVNERINEEYSRADYGVKRLAQNYEALYHYHNLPDHKLPESEMAKLSTVASYFRNASNILGKGYDSREWEQLIQAHNERPFSFENIERSDGVVSYVSAEWRSMLSSIFHIQSDEKHRHKFTEAKQVQSYEDILLAFPTSEFGFYSCGFLTHPL